MAAPSGSHETFILIGGSGSLGAHLTTALAAAGHRVVVVDRRPPSMGSGWSDSIETDLLVDELRFPFGRVVLLQGNSDPRTFHAWRLAMDNAVTTARLLQALSGRRVTLVSSIEVLRAYQLLDRERLEAWCEELRTLANDPCPPWRAAPLCRDLASMAGRLVYGASRLAQERLLAAAIPAESLTVLRVGETFGPGREGVVARLMRDVLAERPIQAGAETVGPLTPFDDIVQALVAGTGPGVVDLARPGMRVAHLAQMIRAVADAKVEPAGDRPADSLSDSLARSIEHLRMSPLPRLRGPLPVVIPPRPNCPDVVAERQQDALWTGTVKAGNRWTLELEARLRTSLLLTDEHALLITGSGSEALRLAVAALCGRAARGELAALPSFTYPATAEILVQMGYGLRFVDVDDWTWTMDPGSLAGALEDGRVRLAMTVDTFGNPSDYDALRAVCRRAGIPLVGDSAAAMGSTYRGQPVGTQADAHAFSMSFAKVLSAGGSGGAVVFPRAIDHTRLATWTRSALMDELHAIVALDQLPILEQLVDRREQIAERYRLAVARTEGLEAQAVRPGDRHSLVHFVVRITQTVGRDDLKAALGGLSIHTRPYFGALHLEAAYEAVTDRPARELPVTERLAAEVLALPMSSELSVEDAERVALAVECLVGGGR